MKATIFGRAVELPARARLCCRLDALAANYRLLCRRTGAEVMAVVKANAYGHGAPAVALRLYAEGCRRFAVCDLSEAVALADTLRDPACELLVLGYTPPEGARLAAASGITLTVHTAAEGEALRASLGGAVLSVQVKLNSGMNRSGLSLLPSELSATLSAVLCLAADPHLRLSGIYSHLATADREGDPLTECQLTRFRSAVEALALRGVRAPTHIAASAAALSRGACGCPIVRAGLALYGYDPRGPASELTPVGRLVAPITQILTLPPGESVGYGATFRSARTERIGLIPIGYADGLLRAASGGYVRVGGRRVPIVGRVSMDSAAIALGDLPRGTELREATVLGEESGDLFALADAAGSIPYEILAGLGPRIERIYQ